MIILSETGGQTCNKFFQYLYYLKYCISKKKRLYVQLPDITVEDYPNLLDNEYISFPFYFKRLTKVIGLKRSLNFSRYLTVLLLNNYCRFLFHQLSFHKLNFVSGKPTWTGTDVEYSELRPLLQNLFKLRSDLSRPIDEIFRQDDKFVTCGIHIRGGDYRTWLNGKYFYPLETYRKAMDNFVKLFPTKKVRFFICSNEPLDPDILSGLNYFTIPGATASQDIYALTKCDYIIGTLSSFNAWASLISGTPLFTILRDTDVDTLNLVEFSAVVNYKSKENGWQFPRSVSFYAKHAHPWLYRHSNQEYKIPLNYE